MAPPPKLSFPGTSRFQVQRRLGAGAMGEVYLCLDTVSGQQVALKTLKLPDPTSIYRFKNEFRALTDISHPNLVSLYEFARSEDHWFFTMELVEGVGFTTYVRGTGIDVQAGTDIAGSGDDFGGATLHSSGRHASGPGDIPLLREALRQLAEGVHALHLAGKLHRDIKPTNIVVEPAGRVVLLDFGLATELGSTDALTEADLVGTALYMSPEQACNKVLTPASDWYSVGALLYEALTGVPAFVGRPLSVLMQKQEHDPTEPEELVPDLPEDLCELCRDLMNRDPDKRPSGVDVLHRLGLAGPHLSLASGSIHTAAGRVFVGRESLLETLHTAFDDTQRANAAHLALVHGVPGIGKTALLHKFCSTIEEQEEAIVLAGRCYEWESVPFKAIDSLIDALSRSLCDIAPATTRDLLPPGTEALARLFPVLRAVPAIAELHDTVRAPAPHEVRRLALTALRLLLGNLAKIRPLILRIDDFQWGDEASATMLVDVLTGPEAPTLLLCLCYRDGKGEPSDALQLFHEQVRDSGIAERTTDISVGPLSLESITALAEARLGGLFQTQNSSDSQLLARESAGSPLFVEELIRYLQSSSASAPTQIGNISLDEAIAARVAPLSDEQRRLLELVAVAGTPISEALALRACQGEQAEVSISVLRAGHLVRRNRDGNLGKLETYHDRIRSSVIAQLSDETHKAHNLNLATALLSLDPRRSEDLAVYFSRAGEDARAAKHAIRAAKAALEALVFERAALFFRIALKASHEPAAERELREALANALANGGRGGQAAPEYLRAAKGASAAKHIDLRRRAAEQYLRTGHIKEGRALLIEVLSSVGLPLPGGSKRAIVSLLLQRATLRLRGLKFKSKDPSQISAEELRRVDICYSSAIGFALTHPISGADFQTRHLLLALRSGEPSRIARALALEACFVAIEGTDARKRFEPIIDRAQSLAREVGNRHAAGISEFALGIASYQSGYWLESFEQFEKSSKVLREECEEGEFDATQSLRFGVDALFNLGRLAELAERVPVYLRQAEQRGNVHGLTDMRTGLPNSVWLVADDPKRAREECQRSTGHWQDLDFFLQHYYEALALAHVDLYEGHSQSALDRVDAMWPKLKGSLLLRVQAVRVEAHFLLGRALLAAAVNMKAGRRAEIGPRLATVIKLLERQATPGAPGCARLLKAQWSHIQGETANATELLHTSREELDKANMAFAVAACDHLLGALLGGSEAAAHLEKRDAWARENGVANPVRFLRLMAPGWVATDSETESADPQHQSG